MKKIKLLALLPLLLLTSCTKANTERVGKLIFEYTEHMEKVESMESNEGEGFYYRGNATIGTSGDTGAVIEGLILVSRLDKDKKNLATLGLIGEITSRPLTYRPFEDYSFYTSLFYIDTIRLLTYSVEKDTGYSVILETEYVPNEAVLVYFKAYLEELKELTYDDLVYALKKLK